MAPPMSGLAVSGRRDGDTALLHLVGYVDPSTTGLLRRRAFAFLACGASNVTIECGELSFMDCAGLSCLLEINDQTANRGGHLVLCQVPATLRRILRVTGADQVLQIDGPLTGSGAWPVSEGQQDWVATQ